ncbi:MAG: Hsp20/alpha crystallin family protein [Lachnospiraceae bacterium]|nr:Hsp20/alpha crystallin family protein [Lachnospiraceae bacterium]
MMPSIFRERLFDDFMRDFAFPDVDKTLYGTNSSNLMKTDVRETKDGYLVDMDLPGFKKDEIRMQLKQGYLTVSAEKAVNQDQESEKNHYIRKERFEGSVSRRFFVGKHVTEDDIHPKYENGILTFGIPKEVKKPVEEENHYISIEG